MRIGCGATGTNLVAGEIHRVTYFAGTVPSDDILAISTVPQPSLLLAPSFFTEQPTTNPPVFRTFLANDVEVGDVVSWELHGVDDYTQLEVSGTNVVTSEDIVQGYARVGPADAIVHGQRWPRVRAERGIARSSYTTSTAVTVPVGGVFGPEVTIREMVLSGWFQEDVAEGPVAAWPTRTGSLRTFSPVQATVENQPVKLAGTGGVMFAKNTAQNLQWGTDNRAYRSNRWWLVIARCDSANNPGVTLQRCFSVNGLSNNNAYQQPHVFFNPASGVMTSRIRAGSPRDESAACSGDFADWNVMIGSRRGWSFQSIVNGVKSAGQVVTAQFAYGGTDPSRMGMPEGNLADMAIDCILIGCGELTDDLIDKLTGWAAHRVGIQARLPVGHPYISTPPNADAFDDLPRYRYDEATYQGYKQTAGFLDRYADFGGTPPSTVGYTTVFFDDFQEFSLVESDGPQNKIWYAPIFLDNVNVNAGPASLTQTPSSYVWDGDSALSLRLLYLPGWKSGVFASVDRVGRGRYWGKGIFEIRCKFPTDETPGYFPAFWSYGREHTMWPTRNRIEMDWFEYDSLNGLWLNTNIHVHENETILVYNDPTVRPNNVGSNDNKFISRPISIANGFPFDVYIYDGQYHIWRCQIEDDFTYVSVDGFLVCKTPTLQEFMVEKYIIVDWAYRAVEGTADTAQVYDMTIDYIKVMQKETELQEVPSAFTALPALSGIFTVGNIITCTPNVTASQIEYSWYRDGYPIIDVNGNTYTLVAADVGHKIRVHVRAESLYGKPHAWSLESATVA